ncbi:fasciclin-like arabinogalactan protein 14 [Curcuma longa]|uniref:fasciclin-like arabinogalactan protein 14 n=1 Tax=Curcuma longa TaxID=136217 RepID=UPI003D9F8915
MAIKLLPFLLLLLLINSPAAGHNITRILEGFPDFSTFNSLLTQSTVANEINRRQTITVLVVDNSAAGALSSLDSDILKRVLAIHVILDYYDKDKIHSLRRKSTFFTTLYQTTGVAENNMGFLNFTRLPDGRLAFGSGVHGAPLSATYVKQVAARPYNISVLQISAAVVPAGIADVPLAPFGPPINVLPEPTVPAPAPSDAESPDADAAAPDADAPAADSPAPAAGSPGPAPAGDSDAPAPSEDDTEDDDMSLAGRVADVGAGFIMMAAAALLL